MEPEPKGPARGFARRRATSKQTIAQLKDMLQRRIEALSVELAQLGADVSEISTSRQAGAMNSITRTLNTVLQMERRERDTRTAKARQRRVVTATRREELARRIAALGAEARAAAVDIESPHARGS